MKISTAASTFCVVLLSFATSFASGGNAPAEYARTYVVQGIEKKGDKITKVIEDSIYIRFLGPTALGKTPDHDEYIEFSSMSFGRIVGKRVGAWEVELVNSLPETIKPLSVNPSYKMQGSNSSSTLQLNGRAAVCPPGRSMILRQSDGSFKIGPCETSKSSVELIKGSVMFSEKRKSQKARSFQGGSMKIPASYGIKLFLSATLSRDGEDVEINLNGSMMEGIREYNPIFNPSGSKGSMLANCPPGEGIAVLQPDGSWKDEPCESYQKGYDSKPDTKSDSDKKYPD